MPGYKVTSVEPVKGGLLCPHCVLILRDAVQTEEGIRLCESCFKEIGLEPASTCTKCGISVNPKQFWPDKAVRRDILEILVRCGFHIHGCPWQGQLKHFEEHSQSCRYQPVQCPNPGCSEMLVQEKMDKHIDQECQFRTVQCEHCQGNCLAAKIEEHYNSCPRYPVTCDRCSAVVARDEFEEHKLEGCFVVQCQVPECNKLLAKLGTERTSDTAEYTNEHLSNPQQVFSHMQKLALVTKKNDIKLDKAISQLESLAQQRVAGPQGITTLRVQMNRQMDDLGKRLSVVESRQVGVEGAQAGKRDKNAGAKLDDMHLKLRQQSEKMVQLEESNKRLQSQVELQSRALTQIQQRQGTTGSWKFAEGRTFESGGVTESRFVQLEKKMEEFERQTAMVKVHVSELELQLQASLASTHNGSFLWRIPDISRRRRDAIEERITSIYSPPFYTGRNGYKMCIRAYLNGDGIGYKTHFSIFFVLMKGEYDPLMKWPFESKVSLILVDQNHRKHIVQTFKPTPESSSFQRPRSDMNVASGCPQFSKLNVLDDENYVKDDVLYIKCIIDTSRIFHP